MDEKLIAYLKEYGVKIKVCASFLSRQKKYDQLHELYMNYLKKNYGYIFDKYKKIDFITKNSKKADEKIWVLWWQGEDDMPDIIKKCYKSVKKHSNNSEVVLLTYQNYEKYIELPDYIVEKFKKGHISYAHMSDILRIFLLNKYGGTWMDAAVFLTGPFPEKYKQHKFFSVKTQNQETIFVPKGKWVIGYMRVSYTHTVLFELLQELYLNYWKEHNVIIAYFLMDYFIEIAYNLIPSVKKNVDDIPLSNRNYDKLSNVINNTFSEQEWENLRSDTFLYTIFWRNVNPESVDSFYKRIMD